MGIIKLNGKEYGSVGGSVTNIYGAFIDPSRVVYSSFVFDSSAHTWTATEDCILTDNMLPPDGSTAYFIRIDGKQVFAGYSTVEDPFVYVKKGQVVEYRAKSGSSLKAYGITQGTNGIFAPVIYSTEEREIGCFVDGKPLYQKSINIGAVTANTVKVIDITSLNVDSVADYIATAVLTNGWKVPLPQTHTSSMSYQAFCRLSSSTQLAVGVGSSVGISDGYVTLQYTKTTDTAGSGNWNTDGVPTHHYSTNEQVIGTYFGKTLYEKSFNIGTQSFSSGQITITNDLSNVDEIVEWGGSAKEPRDNRNIPIPYMRKAWNECVNLQVMQLSNGTVSTAIVTNDSWYTSLENIKIWVRYTKTID